MHTPNTPLLYTVKLGFTGIQNIDCGYSLELPQRGVYKVYSQSVF